MTQAPGLGDGYILLLEKPFCRALTRGWWLVGLLDRRALSFVGLPCIVGLVGLTCGLLRRL